MPLYMSQFAYTSEAWTALARNPEDRSAAVRGLAESMGGRLISFHYSCGEYDGVIIYEAPDDSNAATTVLAVEDTMEVMRRTGEITYRGPAE